MATNCAPDRPINRESGQILVMTAVTMVALLAIAALSLDASFMYDKRNRLHAAADAAAKTAAIEAIRNPSVSQGGLEAFADQQVLAHGFNPSRLGGTTVVEVNRGPASFPGDPNYVEAIVSEPTSTFFGRVIGWATMTPRAMAVAGPSNPANCLIMTGASLAIPSMDLSQANLEMNGCGVAVGGDLVASVSQITGSPIPSVAVTGFCSGTCGAMGVMRTGAPVPSDPLKGLAAPVNPFGCVPGILPTLDPGCYTSIGSTVQHLNSGDYYIIGRIDALALEGTDVMIYMGGTGNFRGSPGGSLTLTAHTSGPYKGIAIFQDSTDPSPFDADTNFTLNVTGAIYLPGVEVSLKNPLTIVQTSCNVFIAKSLALDKTIGRFSNSGCASTYPGVAFLSATIAQ